jgi:uncharacterized cupredoxin-like copper-binding protein
MIMKKKLSLLILASFASLCLFAQTETIIFNKTTHDFGNINEEKGPVTFDFTFKNAGNDTLRVSNVQASCGCTTPKWSKEPILPGKEGVISAQYDPKNRPGAFNKSITVTSNANPSNVVLYIKGVVNPKPKAPSDDYPTVIGALRMKSSYLNLGDISTKETFKMDFEMYNDSKDNIVFNANDIKVPSHIKLKFEPLTLEPAKKGKLTVIYDAKAKNDWGYVSDIIEFSTLDGGNQSTKNLTVTATVNEHFPTLTEEQKMKAPKMVFEKTSHDFGKIKQNDVVTYDFVFKNTGMQELQIRKTKASCGCTASEPEKKTLKPGETSKISATFQFSRKKWS